MFSLASLSPFLCSLNQIRTFVIHRRFIFVPLQVRRVNDDDTMMHVYFFFKVFRSSASEVLEERLVKYGGADLWTLVDQRRRWIK